MLVCEGHDDADWDEENGAYSEREKESVPWEMDRITAKNIKLAFCELNEPLTIPPRRCPLRSCSQM